MNERGPDRSSRRFGHESNRRGGRAPANRRTAAARPRPNEAGRALHESLQHLVRLAEWAQYYLSASKDRLTLAVNESAWKSTFAVLAACVTFAGLVVCVVLTLNGVAGGLAGMFGGRAWL